MEKRAYIVVETFLKSLLCRITIIIGRSSTGCMVSVIRVSGGRPFTAEVGSISA